jgi:hypothetical protein
VLFRIRVKVVRVSVMARGLVRAGMIVICRGWSDNIREGVGH